MGRACDDLLARKRLTSLDIIKQAVQTVSELMESVPQNLKLLELIGSQAEGVFAVGHVDEIARGTLREDCIALVVLEGIIFVSLVSYT